MCAYIYTKQRYQSQFHSAQNLHILICYSMAQMRSNAITVVNMSINSTDC